MYSYKSVQDILTICEKEKIPFWKVVLFGEMELTGTTEEQVIQAMKKRLDVFRASVRAGLSDTAITMSGMSGGQGASLLSQEKILLGGLSYKAMSYAVAVNEANQKMKKVVACPTAGSAGIVPGCFVALEDEGLVTEDKMIEGLLVASGIGNVVTMNAFVAGALGGCQAECGTATSMAAASITHMLGGNAQQISDAAALAMKNVLGLTCDSIAGLVEVPCVKRNGFHAVHSMTAAEMVLHGIKSIVPMDEVIAVMKETGEQIPVTLRETSTGGLATTPTGIAIRQRVGM